jgi:LysM repeat protein
VTGYGIARSASRDSDDGAEPTRTSGDPAAKKRTVAPSARQPSRRTYIVKSGDTLSAISLSTGVPVERLQTLNPDLDVQALQPGKRLKLRR